MESTGSPQRKLEEILSNAQLDVCDFAADQAGNSGGVFKMRRFKLTLLALCCLSCYGEESSKCYPVDTPTGSLKCWSQGQLIYQAETYNNGGIICSTDGKEIKISDSSLCIEESWQKDVWSPPQLITKPRSQKGSS